MAPMALSESGDSSGEVSIAGLFRGEFKSCKVDGGSARVLAELCCRGGWPEVIDLTAADALLVSRGYSRTQQIRRAGREKGALQ